MMQYVIVDSYVVKEELRDSVKLDQACTDGTTRMATFATVYKKGWPRRKLFR